MYNRQWFVMKKFKGKLKWIVGCYKYPKTNAIVIILW